MGASGPGVSDLVERLLWPDLFIIGGGVSKKADKFLPLITSRRRSYRPSYTTTPASLAPHWPPVHKPAHNRQPEPSTPGEDGIGRRQRLVDDGRRDRPGEQVPLRQRQRIARSASACSSVSTPSAMACRSRLSTSCRIAPGERPVLGPNAPSLCAWVNDLSIFTMSTGSLGHVGQRRVAGAEVVDRDPDAVFAQSLQLASQRRSRAVGDQVALGDLEDERGPGQPGSAQRVEHHVGEAWVVELASRDVDRDGHAVPVVPARGRRGRPAAGPRRRSASMSPVSSATGMNRPAR